MEKIKIILVDDHQIVRDGIKALIAGMDEMEVIAEASTGEMMLKILSNNSPDLAIIDIALPDISGIELTRQIHEKYPSIKILILSMYTDEEFIFNSLRAGASGYLPKNTSRHELREAILSVNNDVEYLPETISKIILRSFVKKARKEEDQKDFSLLSNREMEVLKLILAGNNNRYIAEKLFISTRTVESHKNHIMNKLEIKSMLDLVKYAIQNKIIDI
ncbi:MAG: response regulator transcription factor [Bacteroidetes bacterium]|nr:response regulator transcription factor [Bacteroidota bacterium]